MPEAPIGWQRSIIQVTLGHDEGKKDAGGRPGSGRLGVIPRAFPQAKSFLCFIFLPVISRVHGVLQALRGLGI